MNLKFILFQEIEREIRQVQYNRIITPWLLSLRRVSRKKQKKISFLDNQKFILH